MTLPADHLRPIWRFTPSVHGGGSCAIALDPREARFVLEHGATIDGRRYTATLRGWDGQPDMEGRVAVRLEPVAQGVLVAVPEELAA